MSDRIDFFKHMRYSSMKHHKTKIIPMSQGYLPQPEHQRPTTERGDAESSFTQDGMVVQEALRYVRETSPHWVLEPTEVTVEQPANQQELLDSLDSMLGSQQDGDERRRYLRGNLADMRIKQMQPEYSGFSRLNIKPGYNMDDLRHPGDNLTRKEYETLSDNSVPYREIVEDPEQPNVMVTGLLLATGAEIMRSDIGEDGAVKKVYKGMLDGKPVYFEERILPRIRGNSDPDRETTTHLERTFNVVSEHTARHSLNLLSAKDADVLRSIGVKLPALHSPEYHPDTYPNRSKMRETLELYAMMNPVAESGQGAAGDLD